MSGKIFENLTAIDVYIENKHQKVIKCKGKVSGDEYLVNILFDKDLFKKEELMVLKEEFDLVDKIEETEKAIYIITRYNEYEDIYEHVKKMKITISNQINYSTLILEKINKIKNLPLEIVSSIIQSNNIKIDKNNGLIFTGLIVLSDDKSVSYAQVLKDIANLLHIIFAGDEVRDDKISREIPPDIQKIIVKCLEERYTNFDEILKDLKSSKIYRLINPEKEEGKKIHSVRTNLKKRKVKFKIKKSAIVLGIIALVLLPFVAISISKMIKLNREIEVPTNKEITIDELEDKSETQKRDISKQHDIMDEDKENSDICDDEELLSYFDKDMIESLGETNIASISEEKSFKGSYSLKINNSSGKNNEFLIGLVDLNSQKFDYLKNRNVDISMWVNSNQTQDAVITLKLISKDKTISKVSKKIYVIKDNWTLYNLNINTNAGDYIKIYITPEKISDIWIDSFSIEVLK
ncbi:hypothetical protein SAMN02745135_02131 [Caloranaerobacter azorensis DSM 13643]|uniref:Uncharacterized protein n=1 Tax=Caloranaerobacter azorensis DSM 13643 TaxID=1121264 RepID=A0A1M5VUH6_9FIRM|nr:hypothetical protein [Caloranaerobacter azorensis]SHH78830.1 hypothetical protein SAMN02745135_02131 [Caloranaerobacter azorensis DSM 13643]